MFIYDNSYTTYKHLSEVMNMENAFDEIDAKILDALQVDSHLSTRDLQEKIGTSYVTISKRIKKLENIGIIKRYSIILDCNQIEEYQTTAYILIQIDGIHEPMKIMKTVSEIPEIIEVHAIAGDDNILAKIKGKDAASIGKTVMETLYHIPGIGKTKTIFVFNTEKENGILKLYQKEEGK